MDKQIAVTLAAADWEQVVGMINNGTKLILSQLAMQDGALPQVAELSAISHRLLVEITKQVQEVTKVAEQSDK